MPRTSPLPPASDVEDEVESNSGRKSSGSCWIIIYYCRVVKAVVVNMSDDNEAVVDITYCASCGIAEIDDIKLKDCDGCDLVKYCSDECQRDHKSEHEEACKKRAAELRDELLFKQPESSCYGDCPICCVPLPLDGEISLMHSCCSKVICKGCVHANAIRANEMRLMPSCPFCRKPLPTTTEEHDKRRMKRIEVNDPVAMCQEGVEQFDKGEYSRAFEYYTKAAEMGDILAHYRLGNLYYNGQGVEKDAGKYLNLMEKAAIGGHPDARFLLGHHELENENNERSVKHWIIAATQGENGAVKMLMSSFKLGLIENKVLASALRAHKAAVDATKSPERDAAEEFYRKNNIC